MTDADLEAFVAGETSAPEPARPRSPLRPTRVLLLLVTAGVLVWMARPLLDEVAYHFSDQPVLDIGEATALRELPPAQTYVRVSAVLGNKAAVLSSGFRPGSWRRGPIQFRQVLGAPLFLEFDESRGEELGIFATGSAGVPQVSVEGRLVRLVPGGELEDIRQYFERRFAMRVPAEARVLIVDERPGQLWGPVLLCFGMLALAACALLLALKALLRR